MSKDVRISHLPWTDYSELVARNAPIILVPAGSVEQHGPHLPLATDYLIPSALCERTAKSINALVAPPLCYGCKSIPRSGGGQHFIGTTSLDASTLISQIRDLVREFVRHNALKIAFIVGHVENQVFVNEACDLALRDARSLGSAMPTLLRVGYWEFLGDEAINAAFGANIPDWSLEHAGVFETSLMMELEPNLVHPDRITPQTPAKFPPYDIWPYDPKIVPASGILNTAMGSSREKGRILAEAIIEGMGRGLSEAFDGRN